MNIDTNDPRITAFALGELKGRDAVEIARAVQRDPRIRAAVDEVRDTSFFLLDSLGGGEVDMLTPTQREAVRSAGARPVIEDIASARTPFWRSPWFAGVGVAAALALGVFVMVNPQERPGASDVADQEVGPDWSQWETGKLMAPVVVGASVSQLATSPDEEALTWAMTEENDRYREVVARSVGQADWEVAETTKARAATAWKRVEEGQKWSVPLNAGASSWPWMSRFIEKRGALPPEGTVRVEEWINHFTYKAPTMLQGERLHVDVELCRTPWNEETVLMAVHVAAASGADTTGSSVELQLNTSHVSRCRLLGYAGPEAPGAGRLAGVAPDIAYSRGNYVFYELELAGQVEGDLASIRLESASLPVTAQSIQDWAQASPDMRFASTLTAAAQLARGVQGSGLSADGLRALLDAVETRDGTGMSVERREAVAVLQKLAVLLQGL